MICALSLEEFVLADVRLLMDDIVVEDELTEPLLFFLLLAFDFLMMAAVSTDDWYCNEKAF